MSELLNIPTRQQITDLASALVGEGLSCEPPEPSHFFCDGMYLRELVVPAGMMLVGKEHKHQHFLIVTKGLAEIASPLGRATVSAGHVSVSQPGEQRVVIAIEETTFLTVHLNLDNGQDLEAIEINHIEPFRWNNNLLEVK